MKQRQNTASVARRMRMAARLCGSVGLGLILMACATNEEPPLREKDSMLSQSPETARAAGWTTAEAYYDYLEGDELKGGKLEVPAAAPALSSEFLAAAPNWNVVTLRDNGSPSNRVDLTLVGDGYSSESIGDFAVHAENIVASIFAAEPFNRYAELFNVHRVDVISNESGVDHDPQGVLKDTALDMGYYCGGTARALCVNTGKVQAAASEAPGADQMLAVANSTSYGGVGYPSLNIGTVAGNNSSSVETTLHELGHSFADLADEYFYQPATTWGGGEPPEANVSLLQTAELNAQERKWFRWLNHPDIGSFEGGKYATYGIYRPMENSKMRSLGRPFGPVNIEQFILKMYETVDPIDSASSPGTYGPSDVLSVTPVDLQQVPMDVQWTLNGYPIAGATATSLALSTLDLPGGSHTIQVSVVDNTDWVRDEAKRASLMTSVREWTVLVEEDCNATGQVFPIAAEASSQEGDYAPALAIDGDFGTRWASAFFDPEWILLDFGKAVSVNRLKLHWETAASAHYYVEVSSNKQDWYAIWEEPSGDGGVDEIPLLPSPYRYMRIYSFARTTGWGNSLFEIEAFEEPDECVVLECGDGTVTQPEECDDGNLVDGDGCSAECVLEESNECSSDELPITSAWASSIQGVGLEAELAVDGDFGTRWSSEFSDPQWLVVDLGQEVYVEGLELTWETAASANYEVQISNSAIEGFVTVHHDPAADGGVDTISGLNTQGRFVRILSNSRLTGWGNSLFEVRVFGDSDKYCGQNILGKLLPGVIEAEDYVAFYDLSPTDQGSGCGNGDAVDKELTSDATGGECNVGWTEAGEWLEYAIYSETERSYSIMSRVASAASGQVFHLELDGVDVSGPLTAPSYGWQEYEGITVDSVLVPSGNHTLRVVFDTGNVNFNYLLFGGAL